MHIWNARCQVVIYSTELHEKAFFFILARNLSAFFFASFPAPKITASQQAWENSVQRVFPPLYPCLWRAFARAAAMHRKPTLLDVRRSRCHWGTKRVSCCFCWRSCPTTLSALQRSVSGSALGDLSHPWLPVVCNQVVPDPQLPLGNHRGWDPRGHKRLS